MTTHDLKIWPQWYDAVADATKTFEVRKDDRGFEVGDKLLLREFRPAVGTYTGRTVEREIVYILRTHGWRARSAENIEALDGLQPGYCVLGIR